MTKVIHYQNILQDFLAEFAKYKPVNLPDTENKIIIDTHNGEYLLMRVGWQGKRFVHEIIFHFQIRVDSKVWIYANWTDMDITEDWLKQGMLKSDIVLAFHSPEVRAESGYATV